MKLKLSSFSLKITFVIVFLFFLTKSNAQATIATWTYDPVQGTLSNPTPNVVLTNGSSSLVNITAPTQSFTGLNSTTGCGKDNSGKAWSHEQFNPGSSNEVNGVEYKVSTVGFSSIKFLYR